MNIETPADAATPYSRPAYRWYVVTLLAIAYAVSYIDRLIISLMVDPIKASLALSDTQVSLLIGLSFALFYTTTAIPIAWLADRFSRRNIIVSGITVWCLMTTACGLQSSGRFCVWDCDWRGPFLRRRRKNACDHRPQQTL